MPPTPQPTLALFTPSITEPGCSWWQATCTWSRVSSCSRLQPSLPPDTPALPARTQPGALAAGTCEWRMTARISAGCPQLIAAQSTAQPDHKAAGPTDAITCVATTGAATVAIPQLSP